MSPPTRLFSALRTRLPLLRSNLTPLRPTPLTPRTPTLRRTAHSPADDANFISILDRPPQIIRAGRKKHGAGLILLIAMPIAAFALGTWQVQRLEWKTALVAKYEDRLLREPLPLPPIVNTSHIDEFDYRRVYVTGKFRHDKEMLLGPRVRDGENGFFIVTPLERKGGSTVLVNRGWIAKEKRDQRSREGGLPEGEVTVEGLLRAPWVKNMFTPNNRPDLNEFYFPDVEEMAKVSGCQPVWVEQLGEPDLVADMTRAAKGQPIGRQAEVGLRNHHMQYIVTWYALSVCTSIMLYVLLKKPPASVARRVRHTKEWA